MYRCRGRFSGMSRERCGPPAKAASTSGATIGQKGEGGDGGCRYNFITSLTDSFPSTYKKNGIGLHVMFCAFPVQKSKCFQFG